MEQSGIEGYVLFDPFQLGWTVLFAKFYTAL